VTLHYHGTPITPHSALMDLAGRSFCISFARPDQLKHCLRIGQAIMLDNGAFTIWRKAGSGQALPDRLAAASRGDWSGFYEWAEPLLEYRTSWGVIPDVIDGTEEENDALIEGWPFGSFVGAPVWHLHESFERLHQLASDWPRVCIGSSGDYARIGTIKWHERMKETMDSLCGSGPPPVWLHMLRGMGLSGSPYPFASVDSTDIGRNHNRKQNDPWRMAQRWDAMQCPPRWE
jgi:hypothetical protein